MFHFVAPPLDTQIANSQVTFTAFATMLSFVSDGLFNTPSLVFTFIYDLLTSMSETSLDGITYDSL